MIKHELGKHDIKVCSACSNYFGIIEAQIELNQQAPVIPNDIEALADFVRNNRDFDIYTD